MAEELRHCSACGKDDAQFLCGKCNIIYFCSRECQRSAWKWHKRECGMMLRSVAAPPSVTAASRRIDVGDDLFARRPEVSMPDSIGLKEPSYLRRGHGKLMPLITGAIKVAVISTLRDVEDQFMIWLEWYRIIGFAHLFLYFDDPERDSAAIEEACSTYSADFVSFVRNGPELQKEWPELKSWQDFKEYTDDRMCRQLLNIAHCVRRCFRAPPESAEAVDWLLHLDHDELWLPPPQGLQSHFGLLEAGGCRLCLYQNYEAVPEDHTLTPFTDISLFKVPSGSVPKTSSGLQGLEFWTKRTKHGNYFLYYDNGKSGVKIRRAEKKCEFAPTSVHVLFPPDDINELVRTGRAWTNFPRHELKELNLEWMLSRSDEVVASAKVLHYPATHVDRLFRKYDHLKNFPSVRFGGQLVVPPCFHLEARDCYVAHSDDGPEVQKHELKCLLERVAMLRDPVETQSQLQAGTVIRVEAVRASLRLGSCVLPKSSSEVLEKFRQVVRSMSPSDVEALNKLPTVEVEPLLKNDGGLLKQVEVGLDAILDRLEANGWAVCSLGAHDGIIRRARQEAEAVQDKMQAGATVIANEVVTDQNNPQARRGDKMLWMAEQGLSGTNRNNGPTPTVALLEHALADMGMRLDVRLQQSSLQLRITEHCDGMLACYDGGGAAYGAHIDNADGDGRIDGRVLTIVLYLNPKWDPSHGGELAIFEPDVGCFDDKGGERSGRWHIVKPVSGTVVFFRSDTILHKVMPSYSKRFALSMWFCGMPMHS